MWPVRAGCSRSLPRRLERSLAAELTDHVGYEEGDPAGVGSGNSRNGFTSKNLATEVGVLDLEVPRDRNGSFEPQTVRKGQRRREGIAPRSTAVV